MTRQIKLGAFLPGGGQHVAAWRHPEARADGATSLEYHIELAKTAERGLFDAYFLADGLATNGAGREGGLRGDGSQDGDDRRDLFESAPHGDQPAVEKGGPNDQRGRLIGHTKGGMNTKLHAVTDADGRPIRFFMTAGQVSDDTGAAALPGPLPKAEWLLADRGYDADWFRDALKDKGIKPCIPGRKSRGKPIKHDKRRSKRRNRIEIMFGRLKDWRRVATRYDRCPKVFLSAVALAATVMFWL